MRIYNVVVVCVVPTAVVGCDCCDYIAIAIVPVVFGSCVYFFVGVGYVVVGVDGLLFVLFCFL